MSGPVDFTVVAAQSDPPDAPVASRRRASAVGVVWTVVATDFAVFGIIFPILPLLARRVGLSVPAVGLLLASYSLSQVAFAPLWGRLSDRWGRRPVVLAALVGTACTAVLLSAASSAAMLFAAVVVNGCSGGSLSVAQAALTDVVPSESHARALGHLGAMVALGFVVGPGLAAVSGLGGPRLPFLIAAAIAVANAVLAVIGFPETRHRHPPPATRDLSASEDGDNPLRRHAAQLLGVSLGLTVGGFAIFETTFALLGRGRFGFGTSGVGVSFVVAGLVVAATEGRAIGPAVSRLGARRCVGLGALTFAIGLAAVGLSRDFAELGLGLVVLGVGYGIISPVLTAAVVQSAPPNRRGAALGLQQAVSSAARVIGPLAGAGALAAFGATTAYLIGAVAMLIVAGLIASRPVKVTLVKTATARRFGGPGIELPR